MAEESTTPDLVELTQRLLDVSNLHDLDGAMRFYDANAVFDASHGVGVFEGSTAIEGFFEDYLASFENLVFDLESISVLPSRVTLCVVGQRARPTGGTTGLHGDVGMSEGWVMRWSSEGLVLCVTTYGNIAEARAAAERLAEERR